jgi:hypothetical protein
MSGNGATAERSVHERMIAIIGELPAIGKNQKNQQQGFMFRGHDDILNALNPLLVKHGVVVVPDVLEREIAQRTTAKGGVMYEVNLHVRYRFYGPAGDSIEASTWGEGTDSGDKATNKAMTMAFKNVLSQAFAISSAELSDSDAETPEATTGRTADKMTTPQRNKIFALIKDLETLKVPVPAPHADWKAMTDARCHELYSVGIGGLSKDQASELIEAMSAHVKAVIDAGGGDSAFKAPQATDEQPTLVPAEDGVPF